MWTCPACGRVFKRTAQAHYCGDAPKTIDDYIFSQPQDIRAQLSLLHAAIQEALPNAAEKIAWHMPTYAAERNILQFAAGKEHIALYVGQKAVAAFQEALMPYRVKKGAICLPYDAPLPIALITALAQWCLSHP